MLFLFRTGRIDVICMNQTTARSNIIKALPNILPIPKPAQGLSGTMQNGHESQSQQSQNGLISRPTIRRKSSAGLLSSFKAPASSGSAFSTVSTSSSTASQQLSSPLPPTPPISATSSMTGSSIASTSRDVDSVSLYSESTSGNPAYVQPLQNTSTEYLRDVVQKRVMTLTYIRDTHECKQHWLSTILLTRVELDKAFSNNAMRKHTYRFAVLAMSLSNLFDIPTVVDFLRGVLTTLSEFDQFQDDNFKPKMRFLRFSRPPKRAGMNDFTPSDSTDTSYLVSPHMAFSLDYNQTLLSLLDILSEVYQKILRILGPSQFPSNAAMHAMAPLGVLSPPPGAGYSLPGADGQTEIDTALWGSVFGNSTNTTLGSPPAAWTPTMADMFMKIDGKLKKLIFWLLKELDSLARDSIRDELGSLDPLLRNVKEGPSKELHHELDLNL